ncbi:MAG: hypothetical protein A2888_01245, partial [Chlamydiae bacterium RIFCSPLOWO2_01_FULL_28_7]
MDFEKNIFSFLHYLNVIKNVSKHTLRNYKIDLFHFQKILIEKILKEEKINLALITKWTIREYLTFLHEEKFKTRSIMRKTSTIKSFFRYLIKEKKIKINPLDDIESLKREKALPNFINYEQVMHLFNMCDADTYLGLRDRAIMELFYSSGLRLSELVSLNREDFDESSNLLNIFGKGKKQRIVPITKTASDVVKKYLYSSERNKKTEEHYDEMDKKAIFLNKWGKRISSRSVDRNFKRYLLKSGLYEKITPHAIRHTIATH